VLLCIAILVKLDSSGPFIFSQKRVGRYGQFYQMYKFRTMVTGMPDLPSDQVGEADSRITKVGRVLRRLSLDELPQLWNVMKGEMNFIGPRPALHNQYDLNEMRSQLGISFLKPGITGWAQVNGRDSISLERKVELDYYYLQHRSWVMDIKILWMTVFKSAVGADLYRS
jgi:O-antigen biosynthesis protein WbqP